MSGTTQILAPGSLIGGYEVVDVIAQGGMSVVYRARQSSLGREVALKVLSSELSSDPQFQERFQREGMLTAGLEHPHVVPIYDQGESDGYMYIAMRLIEGPTLAEEMRGRGLTGDETIRILRAIGEAIDVAHDTGLVHRDVKPRNILLTRTGNPYLTDFGIAKAGGQSGLTSTGQFVGSINYAAPEQIRGEQLTAAADIYSFTAVLFECLTGQVPFPRDTDAAVMYAHLTDPPPRITDGSLPEFDDLIARGLNKEPSLRFERATQVIAAADEALRALGADGGSQVAPLMNHQGESGTRPATVTKAPSPTGLSDSGTSAESTPVMEHQVLAPAPQKESGGHTIMDAQRPEVLAPVEPEQEPKSRRPSRRVVFGAGAAGLVVAIGLGAFLMSPSGTSGKPLTAGGATIQIDSGTELPKAASVPSGYSQGVKQARWIEKQGVVIGTLGQLVSSARPAGTLPAANPFLGKPILDYVTIGGATAARYTGKDKRSQAAAVAYVLPTSNGDQMLYCNGTDTVTPLETVKTKCAALASTMTPAKGQKAVAPLQDAGVAKQLDKVTTSLNAAAAANRISTKNLRGAKSSASRLAKAYSETADAVGKIRVPPRLSGPFNSLKFQLANTSRGFNALSRSTSSADSYNRAAKKVRADLKGVKNAFGQLGNFGY